MHHGIVSWVAYPVLAPSIAADTGWSITTFTLLAATAVSDRWGAAHDGRLNGLLSAPGLIGAALAQALGGYPAVFGVLAGLAAPAAVLVVGSVPARRSATASGPHREDG